MSARGLGRGLESLIPSTVRVTSSSEAPRTVHISKIRPSRFQPRTYFNEESLRELADSIRSQGLIQPLIVTPVKNSESLDDISYELIAGERRWRALQMAGLTNIPVVIKNVSDKEHFQISLIENIQREDLNPIEEALAYKRLMEEFSLTQEDLSHTIGKSRTVVANSIRLLSLPQHLQDLVSQGVLSSGHARSLASISDQSMQKEVSERTVKENLTVRDVEKIVADWKEVLTTGKVHGNHSGDPHVLDLEKKMEQILSRKVQIQVSGKGAKIKGQLKISYYSLEDLETLIEILKKNSFQ